jgi:hypothetical protein
VLCPASRAWEEESLALAMAVHTAMCVSLACGLACWVFNDLNL